VEKAEPECRNNLLLSELTCLMNTCRHIFKLIFTDKKAFQKL